MGIENEGSYFCFADLQMSSERDPRGVMNSSQEVRVYGGYVDPRESLKGHHWWVFGGSKKRYRLS